MRKIEELGPAAQTRSRRDTSRLRALYEAQKRIGAAGDLNDVLVAICDAAFALVPGATHVTVVLRDDDDERGGAAATSPSMTRVRGQTGPATEPIPVTRSVFRKVVSERAAVIAADAPREVAQTESLMGAQIRSVLGVPLWKGEEILGVLQMDNRESAGVFTSVDLDVMRRPRPQRLARGRQRAPRAAPARRRGAAQEGERLPEDARGVAARAARASRRSSGRARRCARSSTSSARWSTRA